MTAFIEPIQDATGGCIFKVHTFCGNAAHAQATVQAINSVPPASAFVPVPQPETEEDEWDLVRADLDRAQRMDDIEREHIRRESYAAELLDAMQSTDDDYKNPAEPPRCATGVCGLD